MNILSNLIRLILRFFHMHPQLAILVLLTIEEAGIPIPVPGDTLLILAGTEPHRTLLFTLSIIGVATVAVFCGSSVLYYLSRRGGRPALARFGKYIHLNQKRVDRMEQWFKRRGRMALILGRLIPGLRIPTTIMAGISEIPYREYAITAAIAAVIWSSLYYFLGAFLGRVGPLVIGVVSDFLDEVPKAVLMFAFLIAVTSIVGGTMRMRHQRHKKRARSAAAAVDAATLDMRHEPAAE